jgi:hypothetical protein
VHVGELGALRIASTRHVNPSAWHPAHP